MIDFVKGMIHSIEDEAIIVEVHGIGYQIFVPRPESYSSLLETECFIYTHHHFREDWMGLFGFRHQDERHLFRLLLSVSGIGPKGALAIIAQGNPNQMIEAIVHEDEKALVKMPGVGKKTAQRIILDLRDKVKGLSLTTSKVPVQEEKADSSIIGAAGSDLYQALKQFGYNEHEISNVIQSLGDEIDTLSLDILIKKSLQRLMKE